MADEKRIRVYLDAITHNYVQSMKGAADVTGLLENHVQGMASRLAQPIRKVGGYFVAVGAAATAGVGLAIASGREFESTMNQVRAVTGTTGASFEMLEDQARRLGSTTTFTAREAGDAMYFLSSAGFNVTETMSALPGVMELAAAANMDLAEAADIASNVLSGYGMDAAEIGRVNDVLAVTFTNTNTNISQVGEAMSYVAPVARMAGIEFEEAAAAVGLLSNAGIQGSMAGTTLRMIISSLINPSGDAADALERLGINTTDATGQMLPLVDIVDQFAVSGVDAADIATIFGERAGPGMAALLSQGSDALRNQTVAGLESAGTAAGIAETQMEGFDGAMTRLNSAIEGFKLTLWDSGLGDGITRLVDGITGVLNVLQDLPDWMQRVGSYMVTFAAVVGTGTGAFLLFGAQMVATRIIMMKLTGNTVMGWAIIVLQRIKDAIMGAMTSLLGYNRTAATAMAVSKGLNAAMGVIGATLAVAAVAFAAFAIANHRSKERVRELRAEIEQILPEVDNLTEALYEGVAAAMSSDEYANMSQAFLDLGVSSETLTNALMGEASALAEVDQALDSYYSYLLDSGWSHDQAMGGVNNLEHSFNQLRTELGMAGEDIREQGVVAAELEGRFYDMGHAIESVGDSSLGVMMWRAQESADAMRSLSEETGLSIDQLRDLGVRADMTAQEVLELADAQNENEESTQTATEAIRDQITAMRESVDPVFALQEALWRLEDANNNLVEAEENLTEVREDTDSTTEDIEEAERDLEQARIDAARAGLDVIAAEKELGGAMADGTVSVQDYREIIRRLQEDYGLTEEAAESLYEQYEELAQNDEVQLQIYLNDNSVPEDLREIARLTGQIPRNIDITTRHYNLPAPGQPHNFIHNGGWAQSPRKYHNGGLARDEVPAILQTGEYVLSRKMVANLGGSQFVESLGEMAASRSMSALSSLTPSWDSKPMAMPSAGNRGSVFSSAADAGLTIEQHIYGEPNKDTLREARHQAKLAALEAN